MSINLSDLLDEIGVNDKAKELALSKIVITPKTINTYSTSASDYCYTEDELLYSDDHVLQLVDDIVLANLDKIDHKFERVYNFKVGEVYWLVQADGVPYKVIITKLDCRTDSRDDIVIEELVSYTTVDVDGDIGKGVFFNYMTGYDQKKDFFKTREEAVIFFKDKFDLN